MTRRFAAVDGATGETILTGPNPTRLLRSARDDWGAVGPVRIIPLPDTPAPEDAA